MSYVRITSQLKASIATFALLTVLQADRLYAAVDTSQVPHDETIIIPTGPNGPAGWGWKDCWLDGTNTPSCIETFPPSLSPTPSMSPPPTYTPGPTPSPTPSTSPTPMPTDCPVDYKNTSVGINFRSGLTFNMPLYGVLATNEAGPAMECGKNTVCQLGKPGPVTINCIYQGYDPPPLWRQGVTFNEQIGTGGGWSPFRLVPVAGVGISYAESSLKTLGGACSNPYENTGGTLVSTANDAINSPQNCPSQSKPNAPSNPLTTPAATRCYDTFGTAIPCPAPDLSCDGPAPLPTACTNPNGYLPPQCGNVSANILTGCKDGAGNAVSSCFTNLGNIALCQGSEATCVVPPLPTPTMIPGFRCGGAVPLIVPMTFKDDLGLAQSPVCPPDDWCLNNPATFRDGFIHLRSDPTVPAGAYNVTIYMNKNYMTSGPLLRTIQIPPMGQCKTDMGISDGVIRVQGAFPYLVLPASIAVPNGPPTPTPTPAPSLCYGDTCDYTADPTTWTSAEAGWPITYTSPYQPLGAVTTPATVEFYPIDPNDTPIPTPTVQVPFIDIPPDAEVRLSLKVHGVLTLPTGGTLRAEASDATINVPENGTVTVTGDSSSLQLSAGTEYLIGANINSPSGAPENQAGMNVASTIPCFVQVILPDSGTATPPLTLCSPVPPTGALLPTAAGANPFITVRTSRLLVEPNTALPVITSLKTKCNPSPLALPTSTPIPVTIEGASAEPMICLRPTIKTTNGCVLPVASCDCTGLTPGSCTMQFNTLDSRGNILSTGDVSTVLSPADLATYNALVAANDPTAPQFLAQHMLRDTNIAGCTGDNAGTSTHPPVHCEPTTLSFCDTAGGCIPGSFGTSSCSSAAALLPNTATPGDTAVPDPGVPPAVSPAPDNDPGFANDPTDPILPNPPYNPPCPGSPGCP